MIASIHHYELAESARPSDFQDTVEDAISQELFESIPGLVDYEFVRGLRGERTGKFAAIWWYERRGRGLGDIDDPLLEAEYPHEWLIWEDELLKPLLAEDPVKSSTRRMKSSRDEEMDACPVFSTFSGLVGSFGFDSD